MNPTAGSSYHALGDSNEDAFEPLIRGAPVSLNWQTNSDIGFGDVASKRALRCPAKGGSLQCSETDHPNGDKLLEPKDTETHEMLTFLPSEETPKHSEFITVQSASSLVSWGIGWKKPTLMLLFLSLGMVSAVGHHLYYSHMAGTVTSDAARQQWTIWIGTGFTFLVCFFLNSANGIAFTQYIWVVVKRNATTVGGLDKLFGLTGDIQGFISPELWKHAKVGIVMAFAIWSMALTSVIPPGTISVVPSLQTASNLTNVNTFNWDSKDLGGLLIIEESNNFSIAYPQPVMEGIASIVSQTRAVGQVTSPGANSSYEMQFYGPAFSCNMANSSQQTAFNYYGQRAMKESNQYTVYQVQNNSEHTTVGNSQLVVWSAFSPQLWGYVTNNPENPNPDRYGNWDAELPPNTPYKRAQSGWGAQLWVQVSTSSIVCQLTNASFHVGFDYPNGVQAISSRSVDHLNVWNVTQPKGFDYLGYMAALNSMLYGNVTMLPYDCNVTNSDNTTQKGVCLMQTGISSQVLLTGIAACPEVQNNWWLQNTDWQGTSPIYHQPSTNCRNGSVMAALEDLAANITISMLGLDLGNANFQPANLSANVSFYSTDNIYQYDSHKLLISYGAGVSATILIVIVGCSAFVINGISHDASFSSIMTTTRNPELDAMTVGHSLGAPSKKLDKTKLRFGGVSDGAANNGVERAAFGLVQSVATLRKGGKYI